MSLSLTIDQSNQNGLISQVTNGTGVQRTVISAIKLKSHIVIIEIILVVLGYNKKKEIKQTTVISAIFDRYILFTMSAILSLGLLLTLSAILSPLCMKINTKALQFNKYCKGGPVKASKQQKLHKIGHNCYEIQNSVAIATSLVNFSNVSEIADPQATSKCKNIEYAVHMTEIMTTFI